MHFVNGAIFVVPEFRFYAFSIPDFDFIFWLRAISGVSFILLNYIFDAQILNPYYVQSQF